MKVNSSYAAPGSKWTLTPSTPTLAKLNSVSSIHSADANVSLTPVRPRHPASAAEFSSSTRNARPRAWAAATYGATGRARPLEELSLSRFGIDGKTGESGSVRQPCSG